MDRKRTSENSDPRRPKKRTNRNITKSQNENTQSLDLQLQSLLQKRSSLQATSVIFVPAVMDYLKKEGLPQKSLLILDNFKLVTDEVDYKLLNYEQKMYIKENMNSVGNIDGSLLEIETSELSNRIEDSDDQFGIQVAEDSFVYEPEHSVNDMAITQDDDSTIQNETRNNEQTC